MNARIEKFIGDQLSVWPLASENYRNLKRVRVKTLEVGGLKVQVQYNPARRISSEARLDSRSISERPCFLCPENRPEEQFHVEFDGRKGRRYRITLNPYPIFPSHLVISSAEHLPQSIWHRFQDALDFTSENPDFVCFYNGPHSGASAPDHVHFQACPTGLMPLQKCVDEAFEENVEELSYLSSVKEARLYRYDGYVPGLFLLRGRTPKSTAKLFYRLLDCAPVEEGESEPRFNFISWKKDGEFRCVVIFREKHRSHHYFSDGEDHLAISPGCADMGGVYVVTREDDFEKMDSALLTEVLTEVTVNKEKADLVGWRLTRTQPSLEAGVLRADRIEFEILSDGAGVQVAEYSDGRISYNGALYDELDFEAQTEATMFSEPSFILHKVKIGVDFHWERELAQSFAGSLKIIVDGESLVAVNIVGIEDYLLSVISSEMKSEASLEFLKAHAVISRSWVMSQIANRKAKAARDLGKEEAGKAAVEDAKNASTEDEYVKWHDRQDHSLFDVCADDHCQRYQGLSMAVGENVRKAIDQTWGQVLAFRGEICDARFSKCCGGMSETFDTCWEDADHPYLQSLPDTPGHDPDGKAFCDVEDDSILSSILNDYDLETKDFYRWNARYSKEALSELVFRRSGIDFGEIADLQPLKRGGSDRISLLRVTGARKSMIVGKELTIRRWLSESHLKSSAFEVKWQDDGVVLEGKGWGHGVGLCQIGAAVMASKGYSYSQILEHYYPGTEIENVRK